MNVNHRASADIALENSVLSIDVFYLNSKNDYNRAASE